jgi:fused signal recognition particle receptor
MWARLKERLGLSKQAPPSGSKDESSLTEGFGLPIREKTVDKVLEELEMTLLESDVAVEVIERVKKEVKASLAGKKVKWGQEAAEAIESAMRTSVRNILSLPPIDLEAALRSGPKPYVILFLGVNGAGKTTTLAKIAHWLTSQGHTVVMAASDTFRAGAIEQLEVHAERIGVRVIRQKEGADPAAVAFDAIQHAKRRHVDVVLVDTAGRQHTNENLVEEAKKIRRVVNPQLTLYVGDALSGNDMVEQARLFEKELGFDGVVLTKLDADVKGGASLSVSYVVKKPILFVGVGQGYGDLRPFNPDWMVERLFADSDRKGT